jgi:hypothetical protein
MRRWMPVFVVCTLSLALVLGTGLFAQVRKDAETGLDRIEGRIQAVNKDKSLIMIKQSGGMSWEVTFDANTKFTKLNKPSALDQMKEGDRVICLGKAAGKDNKLAASRIDARAEGPK